MFNSQYVNTDPHPYLWRSGGRSAEPSRWGSRPPHIHKPRPEYANSPNPILVEFREHVLSLVDGWRLIPQEAAHWLELISEDPDMKRMDYWGEGFTGHKREHVQHALKVLTRLARSGRPREESWDD